MNISRGFADKKTLKPRCRFHLRHTTNDVSAIVTDVLYKVDISTQKKHADVKEFLLNDIGCIRLRTCSPIFFDSYTQNRTTGSFVLVDEQTNNTVAAGMIIRALGDGTEEDAGAAIYHRVSRQRLECVRQAQHDAAFRYRARTLWCSRA